LNYTWLNQGKKIKNPVRTGRFIFSSSAITANAFMLGVKIRLIAPIPYFEIGFGMSVGSFKTITPLTTIEKRGFLYHIPFSIGVELGKNHNVNVELTYYDHPTADQFSGAFAIGLSIPLD
jgi:hypothetical protein